MAALAGCARSPPPETFRTGPGQIASTTRFRADRFTGDWVRVAQFPGDAPACPVLRVLPGDGTLTLGGCGAQATYDVRPHGRLDARTAGAVPLWVLWVDEDFRTAVIGTPSGTLGWILNRSPALPADRLRAAREVLAFNGYDLTHLQGIP